MPPIRIGLDLRMVFPHHTGLGRYARALTHELTSRPEPDVRWVIIKQPRMAGVPLAAPGSNAEEVLLRGDIDLPLNLFVGRSINRLNLDLYHALYHYLPLGLRVPRVAITLHDLICVEHAHLSFDVPWARLAAAVVGAWGGSTMWHALRRADAVVSISEASRAAVLRRYPFVAPDSVRTVHHGVDRDRFPPRAGPEPDKPLLFCLGNSKPYKNWRNVLRAFARVAAVDAHVRLVMCGRGDSVPRLARLAAELGIASRVEFVLKAPDEEVLRRFHQARALVFVSRMEGFGLPALEAMSAGCPVIASTIPVLREICGDAAHYAEPDQPQDIARAMLEVLNDVPLRDDLRRRGWRHVADFQWRRCAAETMAVYRRLLDASAAARPATPHMRLVRPRATAEANRE